MWLFARDYATIHKMHDILGASSPNRLRVSDRSHKGKGWSNNLLRKSFKAYNEAGRARGSAGVAIPLHGNAKSAENTAYPGKMQL